MIMARLLLALLPSSFPRLLLIVLNINSKFYTLKFACTQGETESFQDSFEDSDVSAGAIALSFYSGFWAYSGW